MDNDGDEDFIIADGEVNSLADDSKDVEVGRYELVTVGKLTHSVVYTEKVPS
jgi:hypothetical protein